MIVPVDAVVVLAEQGEVVVNVKDFGAKGDGVTSDRAAILAAFDYAIDNYASKSIPVTVYFPEGKYGLLRGGMYIKMPHGAGNLTIKGDGADKSTIVYLDEWNNSGSWVAIRVQLATDPLSINDYLHDIVIQDLGVYDTDPAKHAWHVDKGDPDTEETHGFNIQYCVRATIKNCWVVDAGDECFDLSNCIDSVMTNNLVVKNRITGKGGGSFSVGDGSKNVTVTNNMVVFNTDDLSVSHYGFAVEALSEHVEDIYITDNVVQNINGWGVNVGAPNGTIANVLVQNNSLINCRGGGIRFMGSGQTTDVHLLNNTIENSSYGIYLAGGNKDATLIENCVIENTTDHGIKIDSPSSNDTVIRNSVIRNSQYRAIYNAGSNTKIDYVLMDGVGLSGGVDYAILQYLPGGTTTSCSEVSNTVILNCQSKRGTYGVQRVINTLIEQVETSGYVSIAKADLIKNCKVNRIIQAKKGSTIDGLVLCTEAELGTHAITLSGLTGCTVTNCTFVLQNNSRYAVCEINAADANVITNNVTIGGNGIKIVGANTVATGNTVGTVGATDLYRYRIADGKATIMEWLDKTVATATVPSAIDGYLVTAIEAWAFTLCDNMTAVTIPDSVTSIGANAFYGCDDLSTVCYSGTKAEWESVVIGNNNDFLLDAAWYSPLTLYSETVRHSVMDTDNGNGLAFRFELNATGVGVANGNRVNLSNATVNYLGKECMLIGMGAVVTNNADLSGDDLTLAAVNGINILGIPTVYMQGVSQDTCAFATRIINIPTSALTKTVYARPYCIIEVDGEQITVYGDVDAASCAEYM